MRFQADGSNGEIYATGLRNAVDFDFAPWNDQLYATENGRDMLGDDFPPCELNLIERGGSLFFTHDPNIAIGRLQRDERGRFSVSAA